LDVFDFFNVPWLPLGPGAGVGAGAGAGGGEGGGNGMDGAAGGNGGMPGVPGEFNITDFIVDANRDWLFSRVNPAS
jgi:hypothetical protein